MTALLAVDGRELGPRAARTRSAILAAVAEHLRGTPWHLASVLAVARDAGVSAGTVYQYFPDLAAAVRELAADADGQAPEHVRLIADLLAWEDSGLGAVATA